MTYPFQLIDGNREPVDETLRAQLMQRPFVAMDDSFKGSAPLFQPSAALATAINTAIAVGDPLLLTGEAGTGKTQAAYYTAHKLGLELFHFQTKSTATARDLLYEFDTVRYFHDAQFAKIEAAAGGPGKHLNKADYLERRPLWSALEAAMCSGYPAVLLIDEIDKAPRDFPNDLLHELDKMEFWITETSQLIKAERSQRPIVFLTSNNERRLPEPFLRRCVYHHIPFDKDLLWQIIDTHARRYPDLSDGFRKLALERFLQVRGHNLRKLPATSEFLTWLHAFQVSGQHQLKQLEVRIAALPFLGILLKDREDLAAIGS